MLTGANGIGKSTLLKSILGLIKPLSGDVEQGDYLEIGYFEQETPAGIETTCLEEIWQEFRDIHSMRFVQLLPNVVLQPSISRARLRFFLVENRQRCVCAS